MKEPILVADDNPDVVSALRYLLQTEGFEVTTAGSAQQAIDAISKLRFTAVLIDLNYSKDTTSGNEGLELIERIHATDPSISIIAMTAWGSIETAVKTMQAGASDFLQKPWENERLISILKNQSRIVKAERKSSKLTEENKILRGEITLAGDEVFCRSTAMQETMRKLSRSHALVPAYY